MTSPAVSVRCRSLLWLLPLLPSIAKSIALSWPFGLVLLCADRTIRICTNDTEKDKAVSEH